MNNPDEYGRYDHIHWSIIDDIPLDKHMGTTSGGNVKDKGKICLLGRGSDGYHHTLYGPISKAQYWKVKDKNYSELIK